MISRVFVEKVLLLVIGGSITYYVCTSLLNDQRAIISEFGRKHNLNVYEDKLVENIVNPTEIQCTLEDVCGHEETIQTLRDSVLFPLQHNLEDVCPLLQPSNGVLLHGPPGTGKTMLAKAICKELCCKFINIDVSVLENKYYGETSKLATAVCSLARKLSPCVVFFDEIDGLLSQRSATDQSFVQGLKSTLLSNMDGMRNRSEPVVFIGTTNSLHMVDSALKRRMRTHIKVDLPDAATIEQLLKKKLESFTEDVDFSAAAIECEKHSLSCSDVCEVCKRAAHLSFKSSTVPFVVAHDNVLRAIREFGT